MAGGRKRYREVTIGNGTKVKVPMPDSALETPTKKQKNTSSSSTTKTNATLAKTSGIKSAAAATANGSGGGNATAMDVDAGNGVSAERKASTAASAAVPAAAAAATAAPIIKPAPTDKDEKRPTAAAAATPMDVTSDTSTATGRLAPIREETNEEMLQAIIANSKAMLEAHDKHAAEIKAQFDILRKAKDPTQSEKIERYKKYIQGEIASVAALEEKATDSEIKGLYREVIRVLRHQIPIQDAILEQERKKIALKNETNYVVREKLQKEIDDITNGIARDSISVAIEPAFAVVLANNIQTLQSAKERLAQTKLRDSQRLEERTITITQKQIQLHHLMARRDGLRKLQLPDTVRAKQFETLNALDEKINPLQREVYEMSRGDIEAHRRFLQNTSFPREKEAKIKAKIPVLEGDLKLSDFLIDRMEWDQKNFYKQRNLRELDAKKRTLFTRDILLADEKTLTQKAEELQGILVAAGLYQTELKAIADAREKMLAQEQHSLPAEQLRRLELDPSAANNLMEFCRGKDFQPAWFTQSEGRITLESIIAIKLKEHKISPDAHKFNEALKGIHAELRKYADHLINNNNQLNNCLAEFAKFKDEKGHAFNVPPNQESFLREFRLLKMSMINPLLIKAKKENKIYIHTILLKIATVLTALERIEDNSYDATIASADKMKFITTLMDGPISSLLKNLAMPDEKLSNTSIECQTVGEIVRMPPNKYLTGLAKMSHFRDDPAGINAMKAIQVHLLELQRIIANPTINAAAAAAPPKAGFGGGGGGGGK